MATALATLMSVPAIALAPLRTPVLPLTRLEAVLGSSCPRLLIKRDDLLPFALGGNKVRKLQLLASEAAQAGADTLITCGTVQSNHARVTAAAGAALGWKVILVLNGSRPAEATGNLRHDYLFGAEVRFVAKREDRDSSMDEVAEQMRRSGRRPFIIPTGGSTPNGAIGMARGVSELGIDSIRPDVIVHATSSGGTQAGLVAGCALLGLTARVVGISVDDPAHTVADRVAYLIDRMSARLGGRPETLRGTWPIEVDASQVGGGYSIPTEASQEARTLLARTEGIVLDSTYTAKGMAGMIARIRSGEFQASQTLLFWHTGGLSE